MAELHAPADKPELRGSREHVAVIGPDLFFAQFIGAGEMNGVPGAENRLGGLARTIAPARRRSDSRTGTRVQKPSST
jgi:hypothetical protein